MLCGMLIGACDPMLQRAPDCLQLLHTGTAGVPLLRDGGASRCGAGPARQLLDDDWPCRDGRASRVDPKPLCDQRIQRPWQVRTQPRTQPGPPSWCTVYPPRLAVPSTRLSCRAQPTPPTSCRTQHPPLLPCTAHPPHLAVPSTRPSCRVPCTARPSTVHSTVRLFSHRPVTTFFVQPRPPHTHPTHHTHHTHHTHYLRVNIPPTITITTTHTHARTRTRTRAHPHRHAHIPTPRYTVRIFDGAEPGGGQWKKVTVDDYFPCRLRPGRSPFDTPLPLFAQPTAEKREICTAPSTSFWTIARSNPPPTHTHTTHLSAPNRPACAA